MYYYIAEFKFFPLEGRRLKNYEKGLLKAYSKVGKTGNAHKFEDLANILVSSSMGSTPAPLWNGRGAKKRAVGMVYESTKTLSPFDALAIKDRRNLPFLPVRTANIDVVGHPNYPGQALPSLMSRIKDNPNTLYTGAPATKQHERVYRRGVSKNNLKNVNILESFD